MTQKNETPILITALLITLAIVGGGIWLLWPKSRTNPNEAIVK